jgi:hypothetical protein
VRPGSPGHEEVGLGDKYWVALAVDNSIPRPEPDPETGFPPMYFNASPLIVPTDEGDDALCVFTTKGKAIAYMSEAEQGVSVSPAMPMLMSRREDFWEFLAYYPASYVVVDPEQSTAEDTSVSVQEFLAALDD